MGSDAPHIHHHQKRNLSEPANNTEQQKLTFSAAETNEGFQGKQVALITNIN